MISTKQSHDAPVLTLVLLAVTILAIPVVLYILFAIWPESLVRQVAATVCVLLVVAFTLFRNKYETLLIAVVFLSQFSVSLHSFTLDPPVLLQIFLSDLIIGLLILVAFERRLKVRLDTMGWLFIMWIGWLVVASYFSTHLHRSIIFAVWQIKYFVLYALALNITMSVSFIRRIEKTILAVILIQTAIGIAQLLHGGGLGLEILGESFNTAKMSEYIVKGALRIGGTIGATNAFAGYMAMLLVFLLPFVVIRRSLLSYLGFGMGIIALILSLSRAGWLSFVVGSLCAMLMMWRAHMLKLSNIMLLGLFGCLVASGGAIFYADKIMDRFENRQAISSAQGRLDQFAMALPLIENYPITGIGPGVSDFFSRWSDNRRYVRKALSGLDMPNYIHCGQLQIWVESGTPGLVLFLAIIGAIIWSSFGRIRTGMEDGIFDLLRVGGISGALVIMIHISFGTEFNNPHIFQVFWVLLGLARNKRYDISKVPVVLDISKKTKHQQEV